MNIKIEDLPQILEIDDPIEIAVNNIIENGHPGDEVYLDIYKEFRSTVQTTINLMEQGLYVNQLTDINELEVFVFTAKNDTESFNRYRDLFTEWRSKLPEDFPLANFTKFHHNPKAEDHENYPKLVKIVAVNSFENYSLNNPILTSMLFYHERNTLNTNILLAKKAINGEFDHLIEKKDDKQKDV